MPNNCLVLPEAVQDGLKLGSNFETGALPPLTDPGTLGSTYSAFNPAGGGIAKENMELRIPSERFVDRKSLLNGLDGIKRSLDSDESLEGADHFCRQAFDVVQNGVASAFDLSKEDRRTLEKYDTRPLFDARDLQKWGDMRRATNLLGLQMLMARRLCESGCSFVTVSDCGWDYHANNNSPKGMTGIYPMGGQVDHAVAADTARFRGRYSISARPHERRAQVTDLQKLAGARVAQHDDKHGEGERRALGRRRGVDPRRDDVGAGRRRRRGRARVLPPAVPRVRAGQPLLGGRVGGRGRRARRGCAKLPRVRR